MGIVVLLQVMRKLKLLSPAGIARLLSAIRHYGVNAMALLGIAERTYGDALALDDGREALSYTQLLAMSEQLALYLQDACKLGSGMKAGILCKNHASMAKAIFAVSQTGADLILLNAEMGAGQFARVQQEQQFDCLIYDEEVGSYLEQASYNNYQLLSYHNHLPAINTLYQQGKGKEGPLPKLPRRSTGRLLLLTGGTTGKAKQVPHKPSLFEYLNPFATLLDKLGLMERRSVYIATPMYHGYGIAILLLCAAIGKPAYIRPGFDAAQACALIREQQIDMVSVVPLMIARMLAVDPGSLRSLGAIAAGGAELGPKLAADVRAQLGNVLYNLYGTSETGLNLVATPMDLQAAGATVGKPVKGLHIRVMDRHLQPAKAGEVGQISVYKRGSLLRGGASWVGTGDLGYQGDGGYYYLCGRVDDRVVSGGENVYPLEVEQVLLQHPLIADAAVTGVPDEQFGQRLRAYVQLAPHGRLTEDELLAWLRPRLARYQMPREIVWLAQIPYTALGKRDKKQLQG